MTKSSKEATECSDKASAMKRNTAAVLLACKEADLQPGDLVYLQSGVIGLVRIADAPFLMISTLSGTRCLLMLDGYTLTATTDWPVRFTRLAWTGDDFGFNPFSCADGRYSKPIIYAEQQEAQP